MEVTRESFPIRGTLLYIYRTAVIFLLKMEAEFSFETPIRSY
jgi:hypothetical protein